MKKILTSIITILLSLMFVFVTGCGGSSQDDENSNTVIETEKYKDRERSFTFSYYVGGYGTDWLKAVCEDYMDNVNKEVYIELKRNTNNETARENIKTGVGVCDLYQIEVDLFNCQSKLYEVTDLLDMEVYGEPGVKVRDKMGEENVEYYSESGRYYQLPFTKKTGWNWVYNKTTLDKAFGEGNYTLPKTTDELFKFGDELYEKGVFLSAFPGADTAGGDYSRYCYETWFAQMCGYEAYDMWADGYYLDEESNKWVFAKDSPKQIEQLSYATTATYEVVQKLCKRENNYMHAQSAGMQFKDVDVLLYGGKYHGTKVPSIAMSYVGGWIETEIQPFIDAGTVTDNQEVLAIKMPVMSAIIERTPSINDDATLSKVIDFVDGTTDTKPDGVTDDDVEIIREARNMVSELVCRELVITKNASNVEDIKDFICYLASDRAQKIAAQSTRGISVIPYGYVATDSDMAEAGVTISAFTKSLESTIKDAVIIDLAAKNKVYKSFFSESWYIEKAAAGGTLSLNTFTGQSESSETIAKSTYDKVNSTYSNLMYQFLEKYPDYAMTKERR